MFWKKLIFDFIKENKIYIFCYLIIILILYPTETLLLPKIYSKLFEKIETDKIQYIFILLQLYFFCGYLFIL